MSQQNSKRAWEPRRLHEINKVSKQFLMARNMVSKIYRASGRYFAPYFVQIKTDGDHYIN